MKVMMRVIIFVSLFAHVLGCVNAIPYAPQQISISKLEDTINLRDSAVVKEKLMEQYLEWKGTKYKTGGLSKKGVDCSGFLYVTFRSKLGLSLPRSTKHQAKVGTRVSKKNLRIGDLVFFKTGLFSRHVGVYVGNSKFLHASSSEGVTITSLNNRYWASRYRFSKRIPS
jgi:cell wall-associated NlpC family hydrolase